MTLRQGTAEMPTAAWFMNNVQYDTNGGCWLWAIRGPGGYGVVNHCREAKFMAAHRVSWRLFRGPIAAGMSILHKCDVPICVNPDHLHEGTHADNMREMSERGRTKHASTPYSRFGPEKRRLLLANLSMSNKALARQLSVSPSTIRQWRKRLGVQDV